MRPPKNNSGLLLDFFISLTKYSTFVGGGECKKNDELSRSIVTYSHCHGGVLAIAGCAAMQMNVAILTEEHMETCICEEMV